MKVFQELRTAIDSWEENNSLLLKLCGEFDCEKSELMETVRRWKKEQPITNKEKIKELLNSLRETSEDAHGKAQSTNDSFSSAFNEMEYVDASDTVATIQYVQDELEGLSSQIKEELKGDKE